MATDRPFILIASLRRTGSTVLSEALTRLPHCFIFREPHLTENRFVVKPGDAELFRGQGVNLDAMAKLWRIKRLWRKDTVEAFRDDLLPKLKGVVEQVGIKEIHHSGWQGYERVFPGLKIVLTGRDPRDIYLSLYHRLKSGKGVWRGAYTPEAVAEDLNAEFGHQQDMWRTGRCLKVRYEDFCSDPTMVTRVKSFTGCTTPNGGGVGQFNAANPERQNEYALHGDRITSSRVARWRDEPDEKDAAQARRMPGLMPEYCGFWGYDGAGIREGEMSQTP